MALHYSKQGYRRTNLVCLQFFRTTKEAFKFKGSEIEPDTNLVINHIFYLYKIVNSAPHILDNFKIMSIIIVSSEIYYYILPLPLPSPL